jgi:AraC family carnitine catabolism transcriptional activator
MSRRRVPEGQGRISEILKIIESQSPQNISELAMEVNLSQSRLQHLFKQETGVRLGRLLTEQRLQKAAELLIRTQLRIKEIAAAAGYGHASSFSRAFEQRFAQSPVDYRRSRGEPRQ